ncbi:MAG: DnaJ domain-containing protein [Pseudomonadota bacterium]
MFQKGANVRSKRQAAVTVRLASGDEFAGFVFLKYDERLIDLMNDPRAFIPIKRADDGGTVIVAKSSISSMRETFEEAAAAEDAGQAGSSDAAEPSDDASQGARAEADPTAASPDADATEDISKDNANASGDPADEAPGATEAESPPADEQSPDEEPRSEDVESEGSGDTRSAEANTDASSDDHTDDADQTGAKSDKSDPREARRHAPYKILRVSPDASIEEVKAAYKARIKAVHPDAHHGDDEERQRVAVQATQLVNRAYRAIMDERGRGAADEGDVGEDDANREDEETVAAAG